jgi:hypothetical protein
MPTGSKFLAEEHACISGEREHLRFLRARKTLPQQRTIFLSATSLHVLWFFGKRFVFTRPMFGRNLAPKTCLRKKCEDANMSRSSLLSSLPACTPAITHGWQSTLALSLSRSLCFSLSLWQATIARTPTQVRCVALVGTRRFLLPTGVAQARPRSAPDHQSRAAFWQERDDGFVPSVQRNQLAQGWADQHWRRT